MSSNASGRAPGLEIAGRIATIRLQRPEVANRLELSDLDALGAQLQEVERRREVLVLRLFGEGRHFCSGFNIAGLGGAAATAGARFEQLAAAFERARPVTIAAIQGGLYGGATDLALACDFRIGGPAAEMSVPAARLGLLFYAGGLERYVAKLGLAVAKRVLLTAEKLDARQMLDCGYLDRLAEGDALTQAVDGLSTTLAGMAPLALLGMKKHLDAFAHGRPDAAGLARDIAAADASDDVREGASAWQEKRRPVFRGC